MRDREFFRYLFVNLTSKNRLRQCEPVFDRLSLFFSSKSNILRIFVGSGSQFIVHCPQNRYQQNDMLDFLKNILQLLINPAKGWEDISFDSRKPSELCRKGYYPIIGITALSCAAMLYRAGTHWSFVSVIQEMVVTFTIYFAALFFAQFMFSITFASMTDKKFSTKRNSTVIIYTLAIMALIKIVLNLIPFDFPVLYFLAIYIGVIIYKATAYLGVIEDKIGNYMIMAVLSIMIPIFLLRFLFNTILQTL